MGRVNELEVVQGTAAFESTAHIAEATPEPESVAEKRICGALVVNVFEVFKKEIVGARVSISSCRFSGLALKPTESVAFIVSV